MNKNINETQEQCTIHGVRRCSIIEDCGKQDWRCINIDELKKTYECANCKGTKTVFRNLYPGYQ